MHAIPSGDTGLPADLQGASSQFLRFALGDGIFAVPIDAVREILELGPSTPLPLMPAFVRGVMNLRGAVVPVIDLAARLALPPAVPGRRSCIIVVEVPPSELSEHGAQVIGLMVDAVHEVLDADAQELEEPPALGNRIDPRFIAGIARHRGDMVPVLALPRTLALDELADLIGQPLAA
ncbi:purine-binding chemotaxis protein CheW [Ideonella sp. 4Y11]|uniref:Purine-binding chemotaxis protein CheW n=1 Tax=Ideonella aquatica TaxID=2824119 RepID=A0A941BKK9_9BURK|nr:chemotaxis protein CheW [Ideonella aquatica]MBQ0958709.1 purine-binding chemotaxis protein CheW [Ideonella aquatica]